MGRTKGSKNKKSNMIPALPSTIEERLQMLANLIIDRLIAEQASSRQTSEELSQASDA
jgi:hypothetical protein